MLLRSSWIAFVALATIGGCTPKRLAVVAAPRTTDAEELSPGLTVGRYRLTGVEHLEGSELDSLYRFSDGSSAAITAFRYDIPSDVRVSGARNDWTKREGAKFEAVQPTLVAQGRIDSYRIAFASAQMVTVDADSVFEHSVAIAVRVRGDIRIDFQYLYVVCNRFLKLRGSFFGDTWRESEFPNFAREVMRVVHASAVRLPSKGCY